MKILVTGGYGLVGRAMQDVLVRCKLEESTQEEYRFLSRSDCDLRDEKSVQDYFNSFNPDVVVHLASHVGGVYDNMNNNWTYLMDNLKINCNVVTACKSCNVKKVINVLSTCIFPDKGVQYPLSSNQLHTGLPHDSNIGYAYSKRVLHVASKILSSTVKTKVINIIPTNLYGKHDNYKIEAAHVIPALIHKMYKAKKNNEELVINGDGTALRQFLYSEDLAQVIYRFIRETNMKNFDERELTCIVSPPKESEISITDLVSMIGEIMEHHGTIRYNIHCSNGQYKKTTDDNEIQMYQPNTQFTPLKKGLSDVIQYFMENYSTLRM